MRPLGKGKMSILSGRTGSSVKRPCACWTSAISTSSVQARARCAFYSSLPVNFGDVKSHYSTLEFANFPLQRYSLPSSKNTTPTSIQSHLPRRKPFYGRSRVQTCRSFHDYFVTHLPSTSMHPDSRPPGPSHKLPRDQSTPHASGDQGRSPASMHHQFGRDMTVVRIPLRSAKHHFGASCVRGTRPYNEDTYQAGTIDLPAFAKRAPKNLTDRRSYGSQEREGVPAEGVTGDPQVFYYGVFDGHGGDTCSIFLRDKLQDYVERAAVEFDLESSLANEDTGERKKAVKIDMSEDVDSTGNTTNGNSSNTHPPHHNNSPQLGSSGDIEKLQTDLVRLWKDTVGGYFRRFKPEYFSSNSGGQGHVLNPSKVNGDTIELLSTSQITPSTAEAQVKPGIETVLSYSFLKADLDFVTDQAAEENKIPSTSSTSSTPNSVEEPSLGRHTHHSSTPFLGGSTCSLTLISTPTPSPYWHPEAPFTLITAHLGDTRVMLCSTATGAAIPLTSVHHPSSPVEATRLRRYAGAFSTDSFGEERLAGLANTRSFGDRRSKRVGVSAEPEIRLLHAKPAEFSFLALVSDGVTASLTDQEIVDVVKEAKTPEQGAKDVVGLATELMAGEKGEADNATAMVVRLGGWERRSEGGGGSMGTKEQREWRRQEANDPRRGRT